MPDILYMQFIDDDDLLSGNPGRPHPGYAPIESAFLPSDVDGFTETYLAYPTRDEAEMDAREDHLVALDAVAMDHLADAGSIAVVRPVSTTGDGLLTVYEDDETTVICTYTPADIYDGFFGMVVPPAADEAPAP